MNTNEIKDRLFDILNETEQLPIQDINIEDKKDSIHVYLNDGTRFSLCVKDCGNWKVCKGHEIE